MIGCCTLELVGEFQRKQFEFGNGKLSRALSQGSSQRRGGITYVWDGPPLLLQTCSCFVLLKKRSLDTRRKLREAGLEHLRLDMDADSE